MSEGFFKNQKAKSSFDGHGPRTSLPHQGKIFFACVLLVSLVLHLASYIRLEPPSANDSRFKLNQNQGQKVKINIVQRPTVKKPDPKTPADIENKQIIEAPQAPTKPPVDAKNLGPQDHIAKKEMRASMKIPRPKASDPGVGGKPGKPVPDSAEKRKTDEAQKPQKKPQKKLEIANEIPSTIDPSPGTKTPVVTSQTGRIQVAPRKPRNAYESLLPSSNELAGQLNAGFQDYVDDKAAAGDRIDMSTSEYRYIGYFTSMRKAIELVWNYPSDAARRGMEGEVGLEFAIHKDGSASQIKIIKSSGYQILDQAIVEAIKLASPFSPLPDSIDKKRIVITGMFRYILTAH